MSVSALLWRLRNAGLGLGRWFRDPGMVLSIFVILVSSLVGGLVFPLSRFGRTMPSSASKEWLAVLAISWSLLTTLAFAYGWLLRSHIKVPAPRALFWAALCHIPLLFCLALVAAVYRSGEANHLFSHSPFGELIFQPIAYAYVVLVPITAQAIVLAGYRWRAFVRVLPLAAIILVAFGLRAWNLNWALPALFHPDEYIYLSRAMVMLSTGDFNPYYFQNPSLFIYIEYWLHRVLLPQGQAFRLVSDFFGMGIMDPRWDYLVDVAARGVSALAGTLTVPVVYWAGKELWGRKAGLTAAALSAVSFLHVRNSHYATNDILATFFLSASLLFSVRVYKRGQLRDYLLAGLFGGLATSTKYNVGFFCIAILLSHLAGVNRKQTEVVSRKGIGLLLSSALMSLAAFTIGTPYALLDFPRFASDFQTQLGLGADPWPGQEDALSALLYLSALMQGFGLVPLALALLGAVLLIIHSRPAAAVLLSVPGIYLLSMFAGRLFFARFAIPLLPFLALLAGYTIHCTPVIVGRFYVWSGWPLLLVLAALAQPLVLSWQHNSLLGMEDTRALAAGWIDGNAPPGARVATEVISRMNSPFGWTGRRIRDASTFRPSSSKDEGELFDGSLDYAIITSFGYAAKREGREDVSMPAVYGRLDAEGRLVAVIAPGKRQADVPYSLDDLYTPFWHLSGRERPGPTVKIYELPNETKGMALGEAPEY